MISAWLRRGDTPAKRWMLRTLKRMRGFEVSRPASLYTGLHGMRQVRKFGWSWLKAKLYYEPMLRVACRSVGPGLVLLDDIPNVIGSLGIRIGGNCRIEGDNTWVGAKGEPEAELRIGNDSYLGYQVQVTVGTRVEIGSHVLISNRVIINGYDGHPLDPFRRAANEAPGAEGRGEIRIGDYAWICANAKIMKGVTIGRGAVVAAGAVVTRDVPELAVAAGNPARVIRQLPAPDGWKAEP